MIYDVIVIGAGISGAASSYYLSQYNMKTLVLEKTDEIASGTTKANSAIMHAGYDALENTKKAYYNVLGQKFIKDVCMKLEIPYKQKGSFVLDFDGKSDEIEKLYERGIKNGVKDLKIVDKDFIFSKNKHVNENVKKALYAKTAGVISPFLFNIRLAENAKLNGTTFNFNEKVVKIKKCKDSTLVVETNKKCYKTKAIVNAAGLYADEINNQISKTKYNITPIKGEYYLLSKKEGDLTNTTLFPLPTNKGKGIMINQTVDDNILVGPNYVKVKSKEDNSIGIKTINEVAEGGKKIIPSLTLRNVITTFAGIRASLKETKDFVIGRTDVKGFYNLLGIDSPGLSSSLGFGYEIAEMIAQDFNFTKKDENKIKYIAHKSRFGIISNSERNTLIFTNKEYGKIICNCEKVSLAEIRNAIHSLIPAHTLDDIKHRTRAGAGRCQSGFCQNEIVNIISDELKISPLKVTKRGGKSYILKDKTK